MQLPIVLSLALFSWKLGSGQLKLISSQFEYILYAVTIGLFLFQVFDAIRVNRGIFRQPVAQIYRYRFTQVAILDVAYLITFGSELTVVSILPLLFKDTFNLSLTVAGFLGASFGTTTFFARPAGGWLSDMFGRKRILLVCLAGTALGYCAMSYIGTETGIAYAVASTLICSLFVNGGNGAVYAMLPMIKRRLTGQIAGMVGAFGNIGGVLFLVIYSAVDVHTFFLVAAGFAAVGVLLALAFVREPSGQIAEDMPDGTIAMIDVT
jgi:NNP family nitrate/nitrite transporter-like MFS transporter